MNYQEERIAILLLEDSKADAEIVRAILKRELINPPEIFLVERLEDAIGALATRDFDVVLADLTLPDSDGLATFEKLQQHTHDTAIVILSGLQDKELTLAAIQQGAQDFVLKSDLTKGGIGRTIRFAVERTKRMQALQLVDQILDALPAHVSVLDANGEILAVNAAWKNFGVHNSLSDDHFAVGGNYLEVCDSAIGDCSEEAKSVAVGIRSVIQGESPSYWLEYPCHSETEQRWFQVRVTPFQSSGRARVVVSHENISESVVNRRALEHKTHELELW